MDWVATGTMLSGVGTMIVAGAIIHATRTGSGLFAQWQRHREEDRSIALAERTLTTAYAPVSYTHLDVYKRQLRN